jgi:hypothetical protein
VARRPRGALRPGPGPRGSWTARYDEGSTRPTRQQILAFRRRVGALEERPPPGRHSLRLAAWAGLKDSMPPRASCGGRSVHDEQPIQIEEAIVRYRRGWGNRHPVRAAHASGLHVRFALTRRQSLGYTAGEPSGMRRSEAVAPDQAAFESFVGGTVLNLWVLSECEPVRPGQRVLRTSNQPTNQQLTD